MDNKFQLNHAVNKLIAAISAKGTVTNEDEKELSTHLFETVETLTKKGLSEEEAFEVAKLRLGKKEELAIEFQKVNGINMLNKEWVFIFIGVSLAFLIKLITYLSTFYSVKFVSEGSLTISMAEMIITSTYLLLILLTILVFKNGDRITFFIKNNLLDKNIATVGVFATILGTISLLIENGSLRSSVYEGIYSTIVYSNRFTETIIKGTVPSLLVFSFLLSTQSVNKKLGWETLFHSNNYLYVFLLGFAIETISAVLSRMLFVDAWFTPIIFGIVFFIGTWSYLKYNKNNNWVHFALICTIAIFFEVFWGYFNIGILSNMGTIKSPFAWAVITAIILAIFASKKMNKASF